MTTKTKLLNIPWVNAYIQGRTEILKVFSVKGFKTWHGREGVGAESTLYKDGKKIGWITDAGNGGEVDLQATGDNWRMVKDFLATLPPYKLNDSWMAQYGEEFGAPEVESRMESWQVNDFANLMLTEAEEQKQLKKIAKTQIIVRMDSQSQVKDFKFFNVKWPVDTAGQERIKAKLVKQLHPETFAEIVNERYS